MSATTGKRQGLTPTMVALLVIVAALVLVAITIWLRRAPRAEPTQPGRRSELIQHAAAIAFSHQRNGSGRHLT